VTISEPTVLASSIIQIQDPSCFGGSDGSIDLMVTGGTQPYTYAWSNGATTEDLSNVGDGNYDVAITDANNCMQSANSTLIDPIQVSAGFTVDMDTTYLTSGATVQFYNSSANAISYTWDFGDGDSAFANDVWHAYLSVGTYTVVLSAFDSNGCSATANQIIVVMDSPPIAIEEVKSFEDLIHIVQSDGIIYIDFGFKEVTSIKISVFNIIGQEVINRNEVKVRDERIRVNLTNEKTGIYFIKVASKNNSLTEKVIY
ncbi:MAG TPA: PKD domain-containing protein, partial [Flavobacteriales bacterium]|nr:PKD domain-containing protein [Flavobacteriales bacterium]